MKKRFIIHIGPHKTGSTYIQKTLFDNKTRLKEVGIEYSEILKKGHIAHHDLAEKFYTKQYDRAIEILTDIKSTNLDILISSENFDRLDAEDVNILAQAIKGYRVEIIFFKRRLDDLLVSNWQESVKHGGVESWSKYFFRHLLKPFSSEVLNNSKTIDLYINEFGKEKIQIIDFDNAKKSGEDICDLFFETINAPKLKGVGSRSSVNTSLPYSYIEIIRVLNVLYIQKNMKSPHHFLREHFLAFMKKNNKNNELIDKVKKIIEKKFEPLSMDDKFVLKHLNDTFMKEYGELIMNPNHEKESKKIYELPNDNWCMESEVIKSIELIYDQLEKDKKVAYGY